MILYLDCFSGISGDMFLAALLDLGVAEEAWLQELHKLPLTDYHVEVRQAHKGFLSGTQVDIIAHEHHPHRHLHHLLDIVEQSSLSAFVKEKAQQVFRLLAETEARIHHLPVEEVHFHELSGVDTIIDVVGSLIALELLQVDEVYASPLPLGEGITEIAHGVIPLPAPATLEILRGVPVYSSGIRGELVTPTGAALVTTLAKQFGPLPLMKIHRIGYGAGHMDLPIPNLLRAFLGEQVHSTQEEEIVLLETNIDDLNPQVYGYLMEKLFHAGALDVTFTPTIMKKGRPGIILQVLLPPEREETLMHLLFQETPTLGVRKHRIIRTTMERETREIDTPWGPVKVKVSRYGSFTKCTPEFEDCKAIAQKWGLPLLTVMKEVERRVEYNLFPCHTEEERMKNF